MPTEQPFSHRTTRAISTRSQSTCHCCCFARQTIWNKGANAISKSMGCRLKFKWLSQLINFIVRRSEFPARGDELAGVYSIPIWVQSAPTELLESQIPKPMTLINIKRKRWPQPIKPDHFSHSLKRRCFFFVSGSLSGCLIFCFFFRGGCGISLGYQPILMLTSAAALKFRGDTRKPFSL